jgi:ABC-type phosphate/phosphonate transport system ATPase subunit
LSYGTRIVGLRQGRVAFDGPPGAITPEVVQAIYEGSGS